MFKKKRISKNKKTWLQTSNETKVLSKQRDTDILIRSVRRWIQLNVLKINTVI